MTEPEVGRALVNAAHEICPYSKAVMAERAGAKLTNLKSSHVSMLSHPEEVAAAILEAARGA